MTFLANRTRARVEFGHCDPAGFLVLGRVFEYFDTSSWALFEAALGVAPHKLGPTFDIMGIPLVGAEARIVTPVAFGDVLEILSSIGEFRRSSFDVQHRVMHDGELVIEGKETRVWVTAERGDPAKLKARPIPPAVIERFKSPDSA